MVSVADIAFENISKIFFVHCFLKKDGSQLPLGKPRLEYYINILSEKVIKKEVSYFISKILALQV